MGGKMFTGITKEALWHQESISTYNLELSNFLSSDFKFFIFPNEEEQSIQD